MTLALQNTLVRTKNMDKSPWYMYVVSCSDGTFYTGVTKDVLRRVKEHNAGRGAAYTSSRRPVELMAAWQFASQRLALLAERRMKSLRRVQKLHYVAGDDDFAGGVRTPVVG